MITTTLRRLALAATLAVSAWAASATTIGSMAPLSCPQELVSQDQHDGFRLAVEQFGGKLGGQVATVLKEDDQFKPEVGQQIVRKLIDKGEVDAIVCLTFSNVLMGSLPRLAESSVVAIVTNAGPSPLAGAQCKANVFSMAWQNDGAAEAMGKFAQDRGIKRICLTAPNYQAGKDMLAGVRRNYKGHVIDEVYTPVNQPDYSAEIAQLQASAPDAVFVFYPGGMGINFVKQMSQARLMGRLPLYSVFTIDGTTLPSLRDAAAGYDAANVLGLALRKAGGDAKQLPAAVKAAGSEFKAVRGPFRFGRNNMPVQNYYAFSTSRDGGKLVGTALADHADVYATQCTSPLRSRL